MTDYIKREDAIAIIVNTPSKVAEDGPQTPAWLTRLADRQFEIIDLLKRVPTADVEELRQGEWIELAESGEYKCSVCHRGSRSEKAPMPSTYWNYCPNCGAIMEGE